MSLQEMISELEKEVEEEKKRIKEDGEKEIKRIRDEANRTAEIVFTKILEEGRSKIEAERREKIAKAKILGKASIDREKAKWVEKVFEEAKRKILNLPDSEKKEILENLCNVEDIENFDVFLDSKYKHLLENAKEENIGDFGVILRSKDGNIKINNTLTEIIENLRQNISLKVSEILFKE